MSSFSYLLISFCIAYFNQVLFSPVNLFTISLVLKQPGKNHKKILGSDCDMFGGFRRQNFTNGTDLRNQLAQSSHFTSEKTEVQKGYVTFPKRDTNASSKAVVS